MLPPLPPHYPDVSFTVQHLSSSSSTSSSSTYSSSTFTSSSTSSSSTEDTSCLPLMTVTAGQVKRQLERLHHQKAAGPDGISPRILKTCASQLSPVLQHLYNLSLGQERIPVL